MSRSRNRPSLPWALPETSARLVLFLFFIVVYFYPLSFWAQALTQEFFFVFFCRNDSRVRGGCRQQIKQHPAPRRSSASQVSASPLCNLQPGNTSGVQRLSIKRRKKNHYRANFSIGPCMAFIEEEKKLFYASMLSGEEAARVHENHRFWKSSRVTILWCQRSGVLESCSLFSEFLNCIFFCLLFFPPELVSWGG